MDVPFDALKQLCLPPVKDTDQTDSIEVLLEVVTAGETTPKLPPMIPCQYDDRFLDTTLLLKDGTEENVDGQCLARSSAVFYAMFFGPKPTKANNSFSLHMDEKTEKRFSLEHHDPDAIRAMLAYIKGSLPSLIEVTELSEIAKILQVADFFELLGLRHECENALRRALSPITLQPILALATKYNLTTAMVLVESICQSEPIRSQLVRSVIQNKTLLNDTLSTAAEEFNRVTSLSVHRVPPTAPEDDEDDPPTPPRKRAAKRKAEEDEAQAALVAAAKKRAAKREADAAKREAEPPRKRKFIPED